jgi:hypothetical protein
MPKKPKARPVAEVLIVVEQFAPFHVCPVVDDVAA